MIAPKTLTLFKPHRDNNCVIQYNFKLEQTVKGENGEDVHLYTAPCPYGEEESVRTRHHLYKREYFNTAQKAKEKLIQNLKNEVNYLENKFNNAKGFLEDMESDCPVLEDVS